MIHERFGALAIALCLVLQAVVAPCLPCTCSRGGDGNGRSPEILSSPHELARLADSTCWFCDARARVLQRHVRHADDRQLQLPGSTAPQLLAVDDRACGQEAALPHNDNPSSCDARRLQVLLE